MIVIDTSPSPMGWFYKFNTTAPTAERLTRNSTGVGRFGVGDPMFSIQCMTAAELRHIAALMDRTVRP